MKILNLYAGIGGNRKLWGNDHEITAVEYEPKIAEIYKDYFPNDNVIIADAHQYLLEHFKEYDFIWASPPCPTHSRFNHLNNLDGNPKYPDMTLYQEIILLQNWYKGLYCIENVISYYEPLITPQNRNNHYFWANFYIHDIEVKTRGIRNRDNESIKQREQILGIKINKELSNEFKKKILNNCTEPELGKHILDSATKNIQQKLF